MIAPSLHEMMLEGDEHTSSSLDDYTIIRQIGKGGTSTVYLATCNRGRFLKRQVAIKKIPKELPNKSSPVIPYLASSTSLHCALHHPTIVSLLSTFVTPSAHFHVLELCIQGTLTSYMRLRDPPTLSEGELRGLLECLVDALIYLRRELVIHRDIKPDNILLTNDYQIKLSDFGLATRLPSLTSTTSTFCGSPNYVSPEIVAGLPYTFSTDLWSLGASSITCLTGLPPFEADTVPEIFENVSRASYTLPSDVSFDAMDLIMSLLQTNPRDRIDLHRVMSHPFFASPLPAVNLGPYPIIGKKSQSPHASNANLLKPPILPSKPIPRKIYPNLVPLRKPRRLTLEDIRNNNSRNVLCQELSSKATSSTRRVASNPLPRRDSHALDSRVVAYASIPVGEASSLSEDRPLVPLSFRQSTPTSSGMDIGSDGTRVSPHYPLHKNASQEIPLARDLPNPVQFSNKIKGDRAHILVETFEANHNYASVPSSTQVPVGTTRPKPFDTLLLNPQTHRIIHGQVTILASHSTLVDLRHGERRRGNTGDKVLVVNPDGTEVKVYSAPHLNTSCCLVEPMAVYSTQNLPLAYWKQYNDASDLVRQIKERTPKLVLYKPEVKCTLMANGPEADIELLFRSPHSEHGSTLQSEGYTASMRIRLKRGPRTIEIARFVSINQGGEWTKRVLPIVEGNCGVGRVEWGTLEQSERDGLAHLVNFLDLCQEVERSSTGPGTTKTPSLRNLPVKKSSNERPLGNPNSHTLQSQSRSSTLSSIHVPPRPPKLSSFPRQFGNGETKKIFTRDAGTVSAELLPVWGPHDDDDDDDLTVEGHGIQTRFIPSVGWCIRSGSRVSQGGRYRIMFLDGVALEIDVDEELVEFTSRSGNVTRHDIRDCNSKRKIGERMKVFEEFVSMFDTGSESM